MPKPNQHSGRGRSYFVTLDSEPCAMNPEGILFRTRRHPVALFDTSGAANRAIRRTEDAAYPGRFGAWKIWSAR